MWSQLASVSGTINFLHRFFISVWISNSTLWFGRKFFFSSFGLEVHDFDQKLDCLEGKILRREPSIIIRDAILNIDSISYRLDAYFRTKSHKTSRNTINGIYLEKYCFHRESILTAGNCYQSFDSKSVDYRWLICRCSRNWLKFDNFFKFSAKIVSSEGWNSATCELKEGKVKQLLATHNSSCCTSMIIWY